MIRQIVSTRRRTLAVVAGASALVGAGLVALLLTLSPGADTGHGVFIAKCSINHFRAADPIVSPGLYPSAHEHMFWGNPSTNENSTQASMLATAGTCLNLPSDRAGYWWPSFYDPNGNRITPIATFTYYRNNFTAPGVTTQTFPANFKMIAGGAANPSREEWKCFSGGSMVVTEIPFCAGGQSNHLEAIIHFPSCWNGVDLDSADHRSHVAYPSGTSCPAGFPVKLPEVTQNVQLCVNCGGPGYHFSDGSTVTPHADFWNTWLEPKLQQFVQDCLNAGINCGVVSG